MKNLIILLSSLVLILAGCSALGGEDNPLSPTNVPLDSPALPSPIPDVLPGGATILFRDDFSNSSSGWENMRDQDGMTAYDMSGYRIQVNKNSFDFWSNPGLFFEDTRIEVTATKIGGPDTNDFGIICRYVDTTNFYFMLAGNDGYYGVGKVKAGEQSYIGMESWQFSDAIQQGDNAINRLQANCVGSSLTFYINGEMLISVTDTDFAAGDVGLMAGTFEEPGTDILFTNFIVTTPPSE